MIIKNQQALPQWEIDQLSNLDGVPYWEKRPILTRATDATWGPDKTVETDGSSNLIAVLKQNGYNKTYSELGTNINLIGLDSGKPAAAAANEGILYFSTDINGGTLYRSNGATWDQITSGLTSSAFQALTITSGAIDGVNTVYVWNHPPLQVYWQGQKLVENAAINGYTLAGSTTTHTEAPGTGEAVEAYGTF